jgi:hypothetical protein
MKYAQIKNDNIIKIHNKLPGSWLNISNLDALTQEQLSDLSWSGNEGCKFYPVEETPRPDYDPLYEISDPTYTIDDANNKTIQSWTKTPVSNEKAWQIIRNQRDNKLYSTDWVLLTDSPLTQAEKQSYTIYRQALRDVTNQSDPFNIVWPTLSDEPTTPASISSRQIRLWLLQNGISLQMVSDAIASIEDPITRDSVSIEWEYAPYIERSHPMLVPLGQALGLSEADIDRGFTEAVNI